MQRYRDATVFTDPAPERRKPNTHMFKGLDAKVCLLAVGPAGHTDSAFGQVLLKSFTETL